MFVAEKMSAFFYFSVFPKVLVTYLYKKFKVFLIIGGFYFNSWMDFSCLNEYLWCLEWPCAHLCNNKEFYFTCEQKWIVFYEMLWFYILYTVIAARKILTSSVYEITSHTLFSIYISTKLSNFDECNIFAQINAIENFFS